MFSVVNMVSRSKQSDKDQEAINQGCEAVNREEVNKPNLQNIPVYGDNLHYQKSASVDIPQEGYGKAPRSVESYRCIIFSLGILFFEEYLGYIPVIATPLTFTKTLSYST